MITFSEIRIRHLKKIFGQYYYLPGPARNIFHCSHWGHNNELEVIEPVTLKEMLTDLSDKVQFGNNFTSVAECLKLPSDFQQEAKNLDLELYYSFKS